MRGEDWKLKFTQLVSGVGPANNVCEVVVHLHRGDANSISIADSGQVHGFLPKGCKGFLLLREIQIEDALDKEERSQEDQYDNETVHPAFVSFLLHVTFLLPRRTFYSPRAR
jgi:hypothetical protein